MPSATLFNYDSRKARLGELEKKMASADFWDNPDEANRVVTELKSIKSALDPIDKVGGAVADAVLLWEMAEEQDDDATRQEVRGQIDRLQHRVDQLETLSLLGGKYDNRNCYLSIYAREGGTEAQDWTEMLMRMYMRYAEAMDWKVEEIGVTYGEEAGLKDVTLHIKGPFAYGYLSAERGTHRLARVSPFNAQGKRQTSFAAVEIIPEFADDAKVEIDESKLEITPFARSSGPGGQNVNKLATAIRLVYDYEPGHTITVVCNNERKLEQNKRRALAILKGKIELLEEAKREAELDKVKGGKLDMGWGTQIRSYVFYDNRVKDTRTGYEMGNPQRVLDGEIQGFIDAELQRRAKKAG